MGGESQTKSTPMLLPTPVRDNNLEPPEPLSAITQLSVMSADL